MTEFISELKRTHSCGALRVADVGAEVVLFGWVHGRRDLGGCVFVDLRDREGLTQVVFDPTVESDAYERAGAIRGEYVIGIRGIVRSRGNQVNPDMPTGEIEVSAHNLEVFSKAETPPFHIEDDVDATEALRLRYRYLDLRRRELQDVLIRRSSMVQAVRRYLVSEGFLELETPFLTKSTPEGARDYLVPSRVNRGKWYALPQSPQLFKQLFMVAGFERYFQVVKCFRDEDLRADRQPEFTQIDLEMSFVNEDDVLLATEGLMSAIVEADGREPPPRPFPRLTYDDALSRFGSDKPDVRFGLELVDVTAVVRSSGFRVFRDAAEKGGKVAAINVSGTDLSRSRLDSLGKEAAVHGAKGLAWVKVKEEGFQGPIAKFIDDETATGIREVMGASAGDCLLFVADIPSVVHSALGHVRLLLGKELGLVPENSLSFVWVTDFPLLEHDAEEDRWVALHHPFTSPRAEDVHLLEDKPGEVRARAYDLALNGSEIGGGSIRIHRPDLQAKVFRALGLSEEEQRAKFGFLLDAFKYGAPPHGGIAMGMDRIVMLLVGADSIRDTIAFPKTTRALDLMTDAPSEVDPRQLAELGVKSLS